MSTCSSLACRLRTAPLPLLLAGLTALHLLALGLFASGFLLSRFEITAHSTCHDFNRVVDNASVTGGGGSSSSNQSACSRHRQYSKAVWVVVDALRFDFVLPKRTTEREGVNSRMPQLLQLVQSSVAQFSHMT